MDSLLLATTSIPFDGSDPLVALLAWALTRPTAIIPKSITPARIAANLEAVLALTLDADDLAAIAMLDKPGLEGCYCHPKTPWLGRSEFTGKTDHYYG